ncbi:unnamed protein product [Caenorhabditis auriculariae]|uniref:BPTI/Kunitz inhibitor domain-containing protein n=1 Tax=Caenorhabditis auriculariae TaxID=2777116 RepID=A0A8S1HK64_9PELO|nr:unnamed protein product [Caenorhabditis auriculariae]
MRVLWLPSVLVVIAVAELPDDLDSFMEKLFDTEKCEEFISSGEFNIIATSKCDPFTCDFPRQVCARPSAKFQDSSSNVCRTIPHECLTEANGGVLPVGPPLLLTTTVSPAVPKLGGGFSNLGSGDKGPKMVTIAPPPSPLSICQMDAPTGRFCGFRPMFTYNKETLQCDEFWFPGCRTVETNANLFDNYHDCLKVVEMCRPTPTPPPPQRPLLPPMSGGWNSGGRIERPPAPPPTPPPPVNSGQSLIVDALSGLTGGSSGGGGNPIGLGALGMFTGSGLGTSQPAPLPQTTGGGAGGDEDLGLFGLIQQGLMGAQAMKPGQGNKQQAAQAAGKILEQFTGFDLNNFGGNFGNIFNG